MFKQITLGFMLSALSLSFSFALTLEDLQKKLNYPVITADFMQKRSLQGMKKPIISSGNFIVSVDKGLYWSQVSPFNLTMVLTKDKLLQQVENGKPEILTAKNNPQIFQFNQLLSSLFSMNIQDMNEYFNISMTENNGHWTLVLDPKKEPINKIFKKITLKGQGFINEVELLDQQNDRTLIQFNHHQSFDVLSAQEAKKFNL